MSKAAQLAEGLGRNFAAPYSAPVLPLRNQPCKIFSFIAMGATVGGLTEAFTVYLHKGGRWTRQNHPGPKSIGVFESDSEQPSDLRPLNLSRNPGLSASVR
jgi:hypothetical protein